MTPTGFRQRLDRLTEAPVLFPIVALLILVVIWGATLNIITIERDAAERAVKASSIELAETYEAQAVRAVREITGTLKLVRHTIAAGSRPVLPPLEASELLPSSMLFVVAIADRHGAIVESTRSLPLNNIAGRKFFEDQRAHDRPVAGLPWADHENDVTWLPFTSAISAPDGTFAGVVLVAVDARYFVSGYDHTRLGQHGVIGLLGTDGIFRVRRSGDNVHFGEQVDYAAIVGDAEPGEVSTLLAEDSGDGMSRYTSAIPLFDYPLAIVVGLSTEERLTALADDIRIYVLRAVVASVAAGIVLGLLGHLSWKLQRSRMRAMEDQAAHARQIEYLASHDSLTGLPNRSFFAHYLRKIIQASRLGGERLAVLFLDLDRFKVINDTLGHEAGDEMLVMIGSRLKEALRKRDFVARFGGDEFIVLVPLREGLWEITEVASKLLAKIGEPCQLAGREIRPSASIGVSVFPEDGEDEQTLMMNADTAMYHAKAEGKNNFQYYSAQLGKGTLDRLTLESDLTRALERDEFLLYYQARFDLRSNRITSVEALLRWQPPEANIVAPMRFIPLAEETGQIVPIGSWVLRTACRQSVAWQQQGLPPLTMAVNLSARQFMDERLPEVITAVLEETGMDPRLLELEITESMLMHDVKQSVRILNELRRLGIRTAVDDFGTGFSSLSTLKSFPLDTIKIDGLFIRDVIENIEDRGLTEAIIALGRTLRLTIVAEGVETVEQVNFLRVKSCDQIQGFYINRPMPADSFAEFQRQQEASQSKLVNPG